MRPVAKITLAGILLLLACSCGVQTNVLDLSGTWQASLDSLATFHSMQLPGTTDLAGLGTPDTLKPSISQPQIQRLARKYSFVGAAFYKRNVDIPKSMAGKPLVLKLERVLWQSSVWLDGRQLPGAEESLTTPHRYIIPEGLAAGRHELMLRIDNRKRYDISMGDLAHSYTNETQVMWNGVLGEISLTVMQPVEIARVDVYPDPVALAARVRTILVKTKDSSGSVKIEYKVDGAGKTSHRVDVKADTTVVEDTVKFAKGAELWDEFNPAMHKLQVTCGKGSRTVSFGIRSFITQGRNILVNGRKIFLRGILNCCIYPLTGTPPMDEAGWEKEFNVCREWGFNHIRFHSWCPPEAAFSVADRMGLYLQVELPDWARTIGDEKVDKFLITEYDRIIADYGNHPSFCMLTCGNELDRGYDVLNGFLKHMKASDSRHIYTNSTYSMGEGHKGRPEPQDQYMVASRTYLGQIRGQDYLNSESPDFTRDYSQYTADFSIPLISHEIGQYSVFPRMSEIEKYKGTLDPLGFKGIRNSLQARGLLASAESFTMASGRLAAILYKEEVERALKTPALSGFQMLGLQDYPGQGTATVGLVDSFWDSKGLVSEDWFKQACSPVTPLVRYRKPCWNSDEKFSASIEVANYWSRDLTADVSWKLVSGAKTTDEDGKLVTAPADPAELVIASGVIHSVSLPTGYTTKISKEISADLNSVRSASELLLEVTVKNQSNSWTNSWNIWVYPQAQIPDYGEVVVTSRLDVAMNVLSEGGTVLLAPDPVQLKGAPGKFVPVFWSPVFFPSEAGTMGVLCNPKHPALAGFPTEMNSNWQWWHLTKNSKALDIGAMPQVQPIVQAVDNFTQNRRLAYIFEAQCESGRIIVCSMNLLGPGVPASSPAPARGNSSVSLSAAIGSAVHAISSVNAMPSMNGMQGAQAGSDLLPAPNPEVRQMLISLVDYMNSPSFNPGGRIDKDQLASFFIKR